MESWLSVGSYDLDRIDGPVTLRRAEAGEGFNGIGKDFLDMENMPVLADSRGIFGSSMSDSTRAMITEKTSNILVVIYCFENTINLPALLVQAADSFARFANVPKSERWIVG